jgi:hypothetical protein
MVQLEAGPLGYLAALAGVVAIAGSVARHAQRS